MQIIDIIGIVGRMRGRVCLTAVKLASFQNTINTNTIQKDPFLFLFFFRHSRPIIRSLSLSLSFNM